MTVTHATEVDRGSETGTFDSATEETNTYLTTYYVATIAIIKTFPHCVVRLFRNREYGGYQAWEQFMVQTYRSTTIIYVIINCAMPHFDTLSQRRIFCRQNVTVK